MIIECRAKPVTPRALDRASGACRYEQLALVRLHSNSLQSQNGQQNWCSPDRVRLVLLLTCKAALSFPLCSVCPFFAPEFFHQLIHYHTRFRLRMLRTQMERLLFLEGR
jgi:hypothetical protein